MNQVTDDLEGAREPRILVFDIETAPIKAWCWKIFDENIGLNQIVADWHLLSWAAKWVGKKEVFYADQRYEENVEDDRRILEKLWKLLDEADVVIGQNSKQFDVKKVNTRLAVHGMGPPSPYRQIDTRELARKHFGFTSNSLEHLSNQLALGNKKTKSRKFPGFELWAECLKGNREAWAELEFYNKADVLATEELYKRLAPWGTGVDLNVYYGDPIFRCQCGSTDLERRGYRFSPAGKYQRFKCKSCGAWTTSQGAQNNLLSGAKRASLKNPK